MKCLHGKYTHLVPVCKYRRICSLCISAQIDISRSCMLVEFTKWYIHNMYIFRSSKGFHIDMSTSSPCAGNYYRSYTVEFTNSICTILTIIHTPCSDPYLLVVTREGVSQVHMNGTKGKVFTNQTDVKFVDYHYRYVGIHDRDTDAVRMDVLC